MDKDVGLLQFTFYTDKTKQQIWNELDQLDASLQQKLSKMGITSEGFKPNTRFFHYGACDPNTTEILNLIKAVKEATGQDLMVCGSCLSDLSVLFKHGSSQTFAYGCGRDFSMPGGAHQANEFIECEDLVKFAKNIASYVLKTVF